MENNSRELLRDNGVSYQIMQPFHLEEATKILIEAFKETPFMVAFAETNKDFEQ